VGAHSEWLDNLARYGIVGAVLFWGFAIFFVKEIYNAISLSRSKKVYLASMLLVMIIGFVNPITSLPAISVVIFLIIPNLMLYLEYQKKLLKAGETFENSNSSIR